MRFLLHQRDLQLGFWHHQRRNDNGGRLGLARREREISAHQVQPSERPQGGDELGGLRLGQSGQRLDGVAAQGLRTQQGQRIGQGGRQRKAAQGFQQVRQGLPAPVGFAAEHLHQLPVDFRVLEGVPDQRAVIEGKLQINAEIAIEGARQPGQLQDRVFHGVQEYGCQQLVQALVPLLQGHQAPLDHAIAHPGPFPIGEQFLQRGHVEDAAPDEEITELLTYGIAAKVLQVAVGPVEASGAVVLFQHEFTLGLLLVEGSHEGRQEMADGDFGHLGSGG